MKKTASLIGICCLGLVAALGIISSGQNSRETQQNSTAVRYVLTPAKPAIKKFEWRQPLLHPTYPPKLVKGEKEFVLK